MTGFTPHADLRPGRIETIGRSIKVLLQICRMAKGALLVPILIDAGPMQGMASW